MVRGSGIAGLTSMIAVAAMLFASGCAMVGVPEARNVNVPAPTQAEGRKHAINDRPDSVMYLPLGEDVLIPEVAEDDSFPNEKVGPFELRGETLAAALQLILADYDISIAFETQEGLTRRITVANLRGDLDKVVNQVCSLANLYCSYEDGTITVKDTQTFTVTLPPIGAQGNTDFMTNVAGGLSAILGSAQGSTQPIVDTTTRTIVYNATQRTSAIAQRYFQRLRANTAMIVFETYIWEVSLNSGSSMGVDWFQLAEFGKFSTGLRMNGAVGADFTNPVSIGIPSTTQDFNGTTGDLVQFLSQFGAVKSISQPQITVLSGSEAELRVADTQNYVSQVATTLSDGQSTTSVSTDSVDTGFTLTVGSTWDKATVYANIEIELTDVKQIDDFTFSDAGDDGAETIIQLPQTSERQLSTQVRVRPGDSLLIAGLVRENDDYNSRGLGMMKPLLPDSRTAQAQNLELVILLRPRVIVYTATNDQRYVNYATKKHMPTHANADAVSPAADYQNLPPVRPNDALAPVPLTPEPAFDSVPAVPVPSAPVVPSWDAAPSANAPLPITGAAPSPQPYVPQRASGGVSRGGPSEPSVVVSPLPPPPSNSAYPAPQPVYPQAAPAPSGDNAGAASRSPYETYDYYTPSF